MSEQKNRSASEKISDLEQGFVGLYQTVNNMARDVMVIKEAIKLLGNKVDSIVKASTRGEVLNDDTIAKIMIENNELELKSKVDTLKFQGVLEDAEMVGSDSFVAGKEIDETGTVVNPRLQFSVQSFGDDIKSKLIGSKAGDVVTIEEGKLKLEITEVYTIKAPPAQAQV